MMHWTSPQHPLVQGPAILCTRPRDTHGQDWRPVQTCSLEDSLPVLTSRGRSGLYAYYWNALLFCLTWFWLFTLFILIIYLVYFIVNFDCLPGLFWLFTMFILVVYFVYLIVYLVYFDCLPCLFWLFTLFIWLFTLFILIVYHVYFDCLPCLFWLFTLFLFQAAAECILNVVNSLPLSTEPAGSRHLAPSGDPGRHLQLIQCSASELMPYCVQLLLNCLRVSAPHPGDNFFPRNYGFSRNLGKIQDWRLPALGWCLLLKILGGMGGAPLDKRVVWQQVMVFMHS